MCIHYFFFFAFISIIWPIIFPSQCLSGITTCITYSGYSTLVLSSWLSTNYNLFFVWFHLFWEFSFMHSFSSLYHSFLVTSFIYFSYIFYYSHFLFFYCGFLSGKPATCSRSSPKTFHCQSSFPSLLVVIHCLFYVRFNP